MKATPEPAGVADPDISAFLDHLRIERRLSPRTVEAYRHDLLRLDLYRSERSLPGWGQLDTQHMRHFIASHDPPGLVVDGHPGRHHIEYARQSAQHGIKAKTRI